MSRPTNSAIHGYSVSEVLDAIQKHLESEDFDFKSRKFDPTFDTKIVADITTASGKLGKGRGLYVIHSNINPETNEYWSAVSYNTFSGQGKNETWSFSEYYLQHKEERLRNGVVKPKVMTPKEQKKFDEDQKRERQRRLQAEINDKAKKDAAAIYVEFDHARASDIRTFRSFKNHTNNYPYIKHKGLRHAYGLKFLPESPINKDELKKHIETKYADKFPDPAYREKLFNNIVTLEKEYIHGQDGKEKSHNRRNFAVLMIPLHNVKNEIKSAQLLNGYYQKGNELDDFGRKKLSSFKALLSDGVSSASFAVINNSGRPEDQFFNKDKKIYTISEGWASAASLAEIAEHAYPKSHHQMQHIFGVNTLNLPKVATAILEENPNATVLIAFDNDASNLLAKHGANAGLETGCRNFCELGPLGTPEIQQKVRTISPIITKNDKGITDWNDIVIAKGMPNAVDMFKNVMADASDRRKNLVNEYQFLVDQYDAQRQDFFNSLSKEEQNNYRNPPEGSPLKSPYVIKFSQLIAEKVEEEHLRRPHKFAQKKNGSEQKQSVSVNPNTQQIKNTPPQVTEVLPKDIPFNKELGFNYDLNKPVNAPIEPNASSHSILANLLKSVDMEAVRESGMNLVGGKKLNDSFVNIESKQLSEAVEKKPDMDVVKDTTNAIPEAKSLTARISEQAPPAQQVDHSPKAQAENLDHRKAELFTAFWLYQSEIRRAKELIAKADQMNKTDPFVERVKELSTTDTEFLLTDNTLSRSFALLATDSEIRDKLITDLKGIVKDNPEWKNIGKFTQYITDHVVVMNDAERNNLKLQNTAVTKIIASMNPNDQVAPETLSSITDALRDTSNLSISRIARQSLYCEIVSSLESSRTEPEWLQTAISSCEEYMGKSEQRLQREQANHVNVAPSEQPQNEVRHSPEPEQGYGAPSPM